MKLRDLKYLFAFTGPLVAAIGLSYLGWWSWGVVLLEFGLIPVFEIFFKGNDKSYDPKELDRLESLKWFDYLLYINLPLLGVLMWTYFSVITNNVLAGFEWWGLTVSQGLIIGTIGINVAHEIGHRDGLFHQWLARQLLLPGLYLHFTIEHNMGHHKWVATTEDPSTARKNESIYLFWIRSVVGVYFWAWRLEKRRLEAIQISPLSLLKNRMILFTFMQLGYLLLVYWKFGELGLVSAIVAGTIGFLLLESVNYIEHYGLLRKRDNRGRYERVNSRHSWNSNHDLGRVFLFELTRHSDHHYKAKRKYQVLQAHINSPELPYGYPSSILMALIPPLWFWQMNERVADVEKEHKKRDVKLTSL